MQSMSEESRSAAALRAGPDARRSVRTVDITTIGARSGEPHRIEIWMQQVDGRWFLSGYPGRRAWVANLRANPALTVHLKHGVMADLPATAKPVDDDAQRREILAAILRLWGRSSSELPAWQAGSPLFELDFD